jgi:hypothetical protein
VIETDTVTVASTGTVQVATADGSLDPATEYNVRAVVKADHETGTDAVYSDPITLTTDAK